MKSLNFGASVAPRMMHAASQSHCSSAPISRCSSRGGGNLSVVWPFVTPGACADVVLRTFGKDVLHMLSDQATGASDRYGGAEFARRGMRGTSRYVRRRLVQAAIV